MHRFCIFIMRFGIVSSCAVPCAVQDSLALTPVELLLQVDTITHAPEALLGEISQLRDTDPSAWRNFWKELFHRHPNARGVCSTDSQTAVPTSPLRESDLGRLCLLELIDDRAHVLWVQSLRSRSNQIEPSTS